MQDYNVSRSPLTFGETTVHSIIITDGKLNEETAPRHDVVAHSVWLIKNAIDLR